jgi:hypothetical protein
MMRRIAMWAGVGFLIAAGWELLAFATYPLSIERIHQLWILFKITCPLVAISFRYSMAWYTALLMNTATYALIGIVIEILRPRPKLSATP